MMTNPVKVLFLAACVLAASSLASTVGAQTLHAIDYRAAWFKKVGHGGQIVPRPPARFDRRDYARIHWVTVDLRRVIATPYARQLTHHDKRGRTVFARQVLTQHLQRLPRARKDRAGNRHNLAVVVNGGLFSDVPAGSQRSAADTWNQAWMLSLDGDSWANAANDDICSSTRRIILIRRGVGAKIGVRAPDSWRPRPGISAIQGTGVILPWSAGRAERQKRCVVAETGSRARTILGIDRRDRQVLHVIAVDEVYGVRGTGITARQAASLIGIVAGKALMLDGGGSTTLWVKGRGVVSANNSAAGTAQRRQRAVVSVLAFYVKSRCRYVPDTPACRQNPTRRGCSIVCN